MIAHMLLALIAIGGIIVVSLVLMTLSYRSYQRYETAKMKFVFVAFTLFLVQGLVLGTIAILPRSDTEIVVTLAVLIELLGLLMIYFATFRR